MEPGAAAGPIAFDLQELWYALLRSPWASLVLVPADPSGSALSLARKLSEVGSVYMRTAIKLLNGEQLDLNRAAQFAMQLSAPTSRERPVDAVPTPQTIIALDPVIANPLGIAVVMAANLTLICIERGVTEIDCARRTIEMIGREKIIGAVLIDRP